VIGSCFAREGCSGMTFVFVVLAVQLQEPEIICRLPGGGCGKLGK
jgi:hypothetical protein